MKAETVSEDVLPHFLASFERLVKCNYSAEVHRSLALFITYTFHTVAGSMPRTPKPPSSVSRSSTPGIPRRQTIESNGPAVTNSFKFLTKKQFGIKILEMYTRLLCEKGSQVNIRKFAKTVTNKVTFKSPKPKVYALTTGQWLLYLLAQDDPEIVVYGSKILARLLATQPSGYTAKFSSKTGGFWIIAHRLKHWWDVPTLWPILFSVLFGYDVADIDFDKPFDFFTLLQIFGNAQVKCPEVLPVITVMVQYGLRDIVKYQDDPDSPADPGSVRSLTPSGEAITTRPRARSMELSKEIESRRTFAFLTSTSDADMGYRYTRSRT
jgi:hypothetical protein